MYDEWIGCYDLGWKGLLIPEAFSHPAKMAKGLVFRIIEHALQNGLIQPGQTVVDCFGGVGTTALPCLMNGLNYIGVELESRFVGLGRKNIDLWNAKFSSMPKWIGTAQLLQGDSRRLAEVIAGAGLVVSSPPYAESLNAGKGGIDWEKAGRPDRLTTQAAGIQGANGREEKYGSTMGQLGAMKEGQFSAVVSSPPFAGNTGGRGEASRNGIDAALFDRHSGGMKKGTGSDPANLDHLPMGQVGAMKAGLVVSSPPFEKAPTGGGISAAMRGEGNYKVTTNLPSNLYQPAEQGTSEGQLANDTGETFWIAAAQIVQQCALILPPGAWAIWVVKAYVKNGQIVDFPAQWAQLCEACGFELKHEHRAMLVKTNGKQATIDGDMVDKSIERKSFFRRLAEKKGAPRIDWETVLCFQRKS